MVSRQYFGGKKKQLAHSSIFDLVTILIIESHPCSERRYWYSKHPYLITFSTLTPFDARILEDKMSGGDNDADKRRVTSVTIAVTLFVHDPSIILLPTSSSTDTVPFLVGFFVYSVMRSTITGEYPPF